MHYERMSRWNGYTMLRDNSSSPGTVGIDFGWVDEGKRLDDDGRIGRARWVE